MEHTTVHWSTTNDMTTQEKFDNADAFIQAKVIPFLTAFANISLLDQIDTDDSSYKVYHLAIDGYDNIDLCVSVRPLANNSSTEGLNNEIAYIGIASKGTVFAHRSNAYTGYVSCWVVEVGSRDNKSRMINLTFDYIEDNNILEVLYTPQYSGGYYLENTLSFLKDNNGNRIVHYYSGNHYYYTDFNFPTGCTLLVKGVDLDIAPKMLAEDAIYMRGSNYLGWIQKCRIFYETTLYRNNLISASDGNMYRCLGNHLFILDNNS